MKIEHKTFSAEVKTFDDENLIVEHFISTEHKDRGGDIMRAKGMKVVGKPVVLMLHGRGPMSSEPIAKPLSITVDEFKGVPGILARTQFFPDEVGTRLYQKIKGGYVPNWSIGYAIDEAKDIMEAGRFAGRDVTKWQLLEYSPVGVPMNPFAQTIKEFLDKTEKGEEVEFGEGNGWFGIAEEKSCTGCGACGGEYPCPTCKKTLTAFFKEGDEMIGTACEKCDPEKFAELTKAIAPSEDPPADPPPEEEGGVMLQLRTLAGLVEDLRTAFKGVPEKLEMLNEKFAKYEPLLKTLSPEPDGEKEGEQGPPNNPPESKTPPRLVFKDDAREAQEKKAKDAATVIEVVQGLLRPTLDAQVDRVLGRVN